MSIQSISSYEEKIQEPFAIITDNAIEIAESYIINAIENNNTEEQVVLLSDRHLIEFVFEDTSARLRSSNTISEVFSADAIATGSLEIPQAIHHTNLQATLPAILH